MDYSIATRQGRYAIARYLRKAARRIAPKTDGSIDYPNLGASNLTKNAPRALVIYSIPGIERYVHGIRQDDPFFNKHTCYWDSVEVVKILNSLGYIVDYADNRHPVEADWDRYSLVIDLADNLRKIPPISRPKKVHWATFNHWLRWNAGELERIAWFKERTGITIPMNRQIPNNQSDEYADYLMYFGTDLQIESFSKKPKKIQINISSCFVPPYHKKPMVDARNKFLMISGGGALHKGMDIAIEAFCKVPEAELYIVADLRDESRFYEWAAPLLAKHTNIHDMGWYDLTSKDFDALADKCIGTIYLSSACGGPGSIARVLHNGLIPIVTPTGFVRAEHLGYQVHGTSAHELIDATAARIRQVMQLSEHELHERSDAVRSFAGKYHTREAFTQSFSEFIQRL